MTLTTVRSSMPQRSLLPTEAAQPAPDTTPAAPGTIVEMDSFRRLGARPGTPHSTAVAPSSPADLRASRRSTDGTESSSRSLLPANQIPATVAEIARMKDPVLRNYRITQTYHDLSGRMGHVLGSQEANWCTFGAWASRQAGQTIRKQDLPGLVREIIERTPGIGPVVGIAAQRVSHAIARGNQRVFADIAPAYARFIAAFESTQTPDPARLEAFLSTLRPGPVERGGQDLLREGFKSYYAAKFEGDPDRKSELLLLANSLVGLHEQSLVQPLIEAALPFGTGRLVTKVMMELKLPTETLELSEDLPRRGRMFPSALETIESPELRALLARLDRTRDTTRGSGAKDWSKLEDRMNYIVDLFRSRQHDMSLHSQPLGWVEQQRVRGAGYDRVGID